ncbi:MAG TPA: hypothetical protein VFX98_13290 [Longimicrobiaceae bacterium]|nr:hypothetical protein [Longimicrobiaceae bacterium]
MRKIRTLASVLAVLAASACAEGISGPEPTREAAPPRFGGGLMGSGMHAPPDTTPDDGDGTNAMGGGLLGSGMHAPPDGSAGGEERGGGLMGSGG